MEAPGIISRRTATVHAAVLLAMSAAGVFFDPACRRAAAEDRPRLADVFPAAGAATAFNPLASISQALGSPVQVTAVIEPGRGGGPDVLAVTAVLEEGWHLYSVDQKPGGPQATRIVVAADSARKVAGRFEPDVAAHRKTINDVPGWNGLVVEEHSGRVTWRAPLAAAAAGTAEADVVRGTVSLQLCRDNACTPPETIAFETLSASAAAGSGSIATDPGGAGPSVATTTQPTVPSIAAAPVGRGPVEPARPRQDDRAARGGVPLSLPAALLMGLVGGLILNLMPCVLPVLGLKLMSFAQQSGRARQEIFRLNLWYCAGLYAVFFVLATASVAANLGLAGSNLAWGEQFTSTGFNVAMAAIVFAFALSFLGVWELPVPGFIGARAGRVQAQEGPAGSFLKGVLGTVLATPCSGPFLGPVFGFTLTQPTPVTYAVFGAIATGMALPYILVGVFPGLVRFLPRPGAWMETLKEVLGFVMLGTVVFLFTFLQHDWFVPTFALLVGIWAACWWIGRGQEAGGGQVSFGRWVQAAGLVGLVGSLAFTFLGPVTSVIPWEPFSRERLADLRRRGATVLVDFSADWCMTCKYNLATAIETSRVRQEIERNGVVPLLADWTDGSPEIKAMLESLESRSIPVLALFPAAAPEDGPADPIVLRDLITESQVLEAIRQAGPSRAGSGEFRAAVKPAAAGH